MGPANYEKVNRISIVKEFCLEMSASIQRTDIILYFTLQNYYNYTRAFEANLIFHQIISLALFENISDTFIPKTLQKPPFLDRMRPADYRKFT